MFSISTVPEEKQSKDDATYALYDDATIERMKRYYKIDDHDELLKYIKSRGIRRNIDMLEDSKSS